MPISEDEYDHQTRHHQTNPQNPSGMSKAELRRSNKPIMEKRRRARINHCLNELKTLILDAMKKDPARHSKLEKADILEMTVKHLQSIQRQQMAASVATDPTVVHKFKSGFHECAGEVTRFIGTMDGIENGVKQRLVAHLSNCVNGLSQISSPFGQFSASNNSGLGTFHSTNNSIPQVSVLPQVSFSSAGDVNNNSGENAARIQMPGGIQLIPSRLPTGELALLVPNSSNMPFFPTQSSFVTQSKPIVDSSTQYEQHITKNHVSAFTTVTRTKSPQHTLHRSPIPSPASTTHSEDVSETYKHDTPSPPIQGGATSTPFTHITFKRTEDYGQVTSSTSVSPELRNDEMKISYHPIPIYQHAEKVPRSYASGSGPWSLESSRKRTFNETESDGLLTIANEPLTKLKKSSSSEIVSSSQSYSSSVNRSTTDSENSSFETSTSANTSGNSGSTSGSNDSMWRPW
ncbi:protein deadpan-like [Chrysoperla carnea]|uniref:protein deadpan-like n=1 Tax=Chrysoperla carnea TaxID=189513 RepID=UPI001D069203|nr:protein deadpan-like [Chrysoperla carnea]